jgi:hypothetical protein
MGALEAVKQCTKGSSVHNDGSGFRPKILHELKDRAPVSLQGYQALEEGFPLLLRYDLENLPPGQPEPVKGTLTSSACSGKQGRS